MTDEEKVEIILAYWRRHGLTISSALAADLWRNKIWEDKVAGRAAALEWLKNLEALDPAWARSIRREAAHHIRCLRALAGGGA